MTPPQSACGASAPGGQRQRTGRAGSAAFARLGRAARGALVSAVLAVAAGPAVAGPPVIERAAKGERCVEDTATMRRNHMRFLEHQRDDTVHGGLRGAKHSLKGCVDCHASKTTGSVAAAKTDFCVVCHTYAAVKIDCFGCHATKPDGVIATRPSGALATQPNGALATAAGAKP